MDSPAVKLAKQLDAQQRAPLEAIKKNVNEHEAIGLFGTLTDYQFVDFIRWSRTERNGWWGNKEWIDAVRLELDMRMLLKK